ncbi:Short chain dehydrogenase [Pseudomonas syringae pv. solidagae]|uniref:Short chain dehydrogenase n=1 Tax=Pseudomonas syringae pv. solidagae TaxID=264458 RepID=A0A0P9Z0P7_PSESX|nr:Short chain dehydrogenase [Pseudomonas syringae pv. solidagae]RMT46300.1 Short chain dehydrogenase [Pseudomonas syringae pv. solidagae]
MRIRSSFTEELVMQNPKKNILVIGAGSIGQAIARRVSAGRHVLLADLRQDNADAAAKALATTSVDALLALPMLHETQITDPLHAYQLSKRGNALRVMAEAVRWGKLLAVISRVVVAIRDRFHPVNHLAVQHLGNSDVGHGRRCGCAMPMLDVGRNPHGIAGLDGANRLAFFLHQAGA